MSGRGLAEIRAKAALVDEGLGLMERIGERDVRAFDALYERYHRLVFGIGVRMLGDAGAAEDLTQAVFLKLWSAPGSFRGGNLSAWLGRVARNHALDALRSRASQSVEDLTVDVADADAIEEYVLTRLDSQRVRDALQLLTEDQRLPIEMGFFEGLTHEAIARRLGAPLGTVKTRIRSGLRRLRTALEAEVSR